MRKKWQPGCPCCEVQNCAEFIELFDPDGNGFGDFDVEITVSGVSGALCLCGLANGVFIDTISDELFTTSGRCFFTTGGAANRIPLTGCPSAQNGHYSWTFGITSVFPSPVWTIRVNLNGIAGTQASWGLQGADAQEAITRLSNGETVLLPVISAGGCSASAAIEFALI